ncbi:hypothetical protein HCG51_03710 [Tolypothrix sp. PCC 7910]|uniref:hypothetical protein n=1 Tax=Tolypothrix sp. PCC 7910 TaxID=2099387 RepID=UPI00142789EA|nr:hypothetical protein [Tolypothrix sp. PCC 7910]QIR35952.1 hypothetical protein HCG51_03710 [Tolypothrix sp. PCC 7910]
MINRLILSSLSLLLISTATAPVFASQKTAGNSTTVAANLPSTTQIQPFDIAGMAYQGYFKNQGIPSYGELLRAYQAQQITAKDIVQGAVNSHRLSSQALNDQGYIHAVKNSLDTFGRIVVP